VGESLLARGHDMVTVDPCNELMGHAGAIIRDTEGTVSGASDPRSDGKAYLGHR
ncbi:MAG TPA: gamma-glutamyltransferase, partial [Alteromonas macleodii]|nr:gamma-glutamyltransferase [Alteromonas macleodii]